VTESHKKLLLWSLAAFLMVLQLAKGLSLEANLYPLMTSIFTYADGPVRRGLLPSLLALGGLRDLPALNLAYVGLHLLGLVLLVLVLLCELKRRLREGQAARLVLFALFVASPILTLLAATTGYSDVWLVLMLLAVDALLRRQHVGVALLLVAIGILQHEIALVLALPLFVAHGWLQPEARCRILGGALGLLLVGGLWLAYVGHVQPSLLPVAEARCAEFRPKIQAHVGPEWRDTYCTRHIKATLAGDLRPERLILLPAIWLVYGLFPLALVLAGLGRRHEGLSGWQGLCFVGLGFVPYGLIMLAWDTDRFVLLSAFVGWRVLDAWYAAVPCTQRPGRAGQWALAVFVGAQMLLTYPAVNFYATKRVLPPVLSDALFIDSRFVVAPLIERAHLKWPNVLDPTTCSDINCQYGEKWKAER